MLAEEQRIITGRRLIEDGVAMIVPVRIAAGEIEVLLDGAIVSRIGIILFGTSLLAEEIGGHMLHCIEAKAIRLHLLDGTIEARGRASG